MPVIESFEDTTGWSSTIAQLALAQDTTNKQVGSASLKHTTSDGSAADTPTSGWSATSSPTGGTHANAWDRNLAGTRWESGANQANGYWFKLDLGQTRKVNWARIQIPAGNGDYPNGVKLEVSTDNTNWTQVGTGGGTQTIDISFTAAWARYLRWTITNAKAGSWWSIHEIYVNYIPTALNQNSVKTITAVNLAGISKLSLWARADRTGTNFQLGIGESAVTDNLFNIAISATNTWELKEIDISGVANGNKDAITKIGFKVIDVSTNFNFWIDEMFFVRGGGSPILFRGGLAVG